MATRTPLVLVNGQIQQLQAADTISGASGITANQKIGNISREFDGGGFPLVTMLRRFVSVDYDGTITGWTVLMDATDTISIEVRKCTFAQYDAGSTHPSASDKISASLPITVTAAKKATSTTLTGWTTSFSAGDIFELYLSSASAATWLQVQLQILKS